MSKTYRLQGVNPNWRKSQLNNNNMPQLTDLTIGKFYSKTPDSGIDFRDDIDRLRMWDAFDWVGLELTTFPKPLPIAYRVGAKHPTTGLHETSITETFGPLSDDPLENPKKAKGAVKAPFHATPELANIQMSNVMAGGGWKYGDYNYHESKVDAMTYLSAIERHKMLYKDGVDLDDESLQSHLAHIMACCAILIEAQATGMFIDNRPKTGLVAEALKTSSETFKTYRDNVEPFNG